MATQPGYGYGGPNPQKSGSDPRGRLQNQSGYQQQRYENQQGPWAANRSELAGRAGESDYGNYTDIMNMYRGIAADPGGGGGAGGGGGGFAPSTIGYNDPFKSYGGYTEFSQTGGYSPQDIANMRARGISPIRAAYSNAEREIGRQRSLQGGYSPNAIATQAKMAREQGQSAADATQNVEAGLAEARNKGRLAGLGGMAGIETSRLGADLDVAKFNAQAQMASGAAGSAASASSAAANRASQMDALQGMRLMYGTNPGMSQTFGDQTMDAINSGGQFGLGLYGHDIESQKAPGAFDNTMNKINRVYKTGSQIAYPWLPDERRQTWGK